MEHWRETREILRQITRAADTGQRSAIATVVRIQGSAYRRPGAKFLVEESGRTAGSVSGGCLEADVREVAQAVMREGVPRLRQYQTGGNDGDVWGLGLGCNGSVDIFIQPTTGLEAADRILHLLEGETPFAVSSVVDGSSSVGRSLVVGADLLNGSTGDAGLDRELAQRTANLLAQGKSRLHEMASMLVFTEVYAPPPHLLICGAGDDAIPLASYASDAGFRVTVVDHRRAFLSQERFPSAVRVLHLLPEGDLRALPLGPRTCAVVKMHSFAYDREWIRRLLPTDVFYLGLLGPRARKQEILRQIQATGTDRIFAPVGLDLGAEGSNQVALSIVAELLAVCAARLPLHLREKEGAVHGA